MSSSKSTEKETTKPVVEEVETEEVQVEDKAAETKPEAVKAVKEEKKSVEKEVSKEAKAAKKTGTKKTTAKKADKPELKPAVYVEFQGRQALESDIVEKIKAAFIKSGHRAASIKALQIYIKPEEFKAYYVINEGKYIGNVDLF